MIIGSKYECALFVLFLSVVSFCKAYDIELVGKCFKFGPDTETPNLINGEWYCLLKDESHYCLPYECPKPKCYNPLAPSEGKCNYCAGTCSYGGTIYDVGTNFKCLDGSNFCRCLTNNRIASTRAAQRYEIMCRK